MFTPEYRNQLREELIAVARTDDRITGVAVTGSSADAKEDAWSDIDLAFGIGDADSLQAALEDWTSLMYRNHRAVHHLDVFAGPSIYRVFMLVNTLQVDLAFTPASNYGASGPTFKLLFGTAIDRAPDKPPAPEYLISYGWLYALHARSCIQRGKVWQAEYMISAVRDYVLALACRRRNLPAGQGRGMDRLPSKFTKPLEAALVRSLELVELTRAFRTVVEVLVREVWEVDPALAERIGGPLLELIA